MADESKITNKNKLFCEEYIFDWNGSRAYKAAYPNVKDSTARTQASLLLTNPNILAYIEEMQDDLQKHAGVSRLRNLLELKKMAYSNMSDFKEDWMTEKDFDQLSEDTKAALSEIQYTKRPTVNGMELIVKFKVHDKLKAIEAINKMLGYNAAEQKDITSGGKPIKGIGLIDWV